MMESNYVKGKLSMFSRQRVQMNIGMIITLAVAAVLLVGSQALAKTDTNTANTLKVSPVRTDVTIKPGESKKVQTTVTNLTDASITVSPIENDFVAGDERGTPALILDAKKFAPTHSLKRFMTPLKNVTIPAGEAKTIDVTITVPKDAQAGGYFGAIRFAPAHPDDGGQVNLSPSIASMILLTVPGDSVQKLVLTDFEVQQNGHNGSYFTNSDNLQTTVRFENKGNLQVGPFGKISVKKGDNVVYEADFNNKNPRDVILPDSARRWETPIKDIGGFGHYTVTATFTYGDKNQTIEASQSFWVITKAVIIAAAVVLLVVILLVVAIVLFVRKRRGKTIRFRR